VKDEALYVQDILAYLQRIGQFTADGHNAFLKDEKTQFAVIRAYEVIGEIIKRLPQSLCDANPQINWRQLMGFRYFLSLNYDLVILEFVWKAVEDLPILLAAILIVSSQLANDDTP
jgi:uncharacterized protein with HEPN domain